MQAAIYYISIGFLVAILILTIRQAAGKHRIYLSIMWSWLLLTSAQQILSDWSYMILWICGPVLSALVSYSFFELNPIKKVLIYAGSYGLCLLLAAVLLKTPWLVISGVIIGATFLQFKIVRAQMRYRGISRLSWPIKLIWLIIHWILLDLWAVAILASIYFGSSSLALIAGLILLSLTLWSLWMLTQKEGLLPLKAPQKYMSSSLDQQEKHRILHELEQQLAVDYMLQPKASLAELARKVHASPHQLSQVLNDNKGAAFFELMAQYRVRAARKMLRSEQFENLTIEQIGEQVGYLSKSSFNTVFKKITGLTPSEYRAGNVRDHHVERPQRSENAFFGKYTATFEPVIIAGIMYTNFFRIYFRRILRSKTFSFVNLAGLIMGLSSAVLILLYTQHELSYDRFFAGANQIYRVESLSENPQTRTPHPLAQALVRDFPEVQAAVSITPLYGPGLSLQSIYLRNPQQDRMYQEPNGYAADSTFFQVFDLELITGNEAEALKQVGGLIISEQLAKKYFPDENPLGKILEIDTERHPLIITGVMRDMPVNSHFHPAFFISYVTLKYMNPGSPWMQWADYGHFNYVKLAEGADAKALERKIPDWLHRNGHLSDEGLEQFRAGTWLLGLDPITDIHLKSHIRWELEPNGNITYIYIMLAAIVFILIITAINYINLSTARVIERAREIGVRRSLGADKHLLSVQFLLENSLTSLLSLMVAIVLCILILPVFNALTQKSFGYTDLLQTQILLPAVLFALLVGLVSGAFPAVTALGIRVADILKGKSGKLASGTAIRKALVTVQFAVSAVLIFGSVVLLLQVKFLASKPLGYDDQVLAVKLQSAATEDHVEALKQKMQQVQGVKSIGAVTNLPGGQFNQNALYSLRDRDRKVDVSQIGGDEDLMQVLNLDIVEGGWFDKQAAEDSVLHFVINETAAKQLGLEHPVGEKLYWDDDNQYGAGRIVGVVKDFNFQSLHVPIQPLLITPDHEDLSYLVIKMDGAEVKAAMAELQRVYAEFDAEYSFEAFFLDQKNQLLYESERRSLAIFNLFAGIALGLSALGLLGLAYLTVVQRTKEIGIRKILGASVAGLLVKENTTFLKLIGLGLVTGLPLAYWVMQEWLAGFAYRIALGWWPYVLTAGVIGGIAILSVTLAILRTVLANPSEALRYE